MRRYCSLMSYRRDPLAPVRPPDTPNQNATRVEVAARREGDGRRSARDAAEGHPQAARARSGRRGDANGPAGRAGEARESRRPSASQPPGDGQHHCLGLPECPAGRGRQRQRARAIPQAWGAYRVPAACPVRCGKRRLLDRPTDRHDSRPFRDSNEELEGAQSPLLHSAQSPAAAARPEGVACERPRNGRRRRRTLADAHWPHATGTPGAPCACTRR
jgi:hypothetical protein